LVEADPITFADVKQAQTVANKLRTQLAIATVTTNETVTFNIGTLVYAAAAKASDGSVVTCTKSGGVVTITQAALTDELVYIHVVGSV
jgi:hypothetical protein